MNRKLFRNVLLLTAIVAAPAVVEAQVGTVSNVASVNLSATRDPSITVTPSSATMTMPGSIVDNSTANVIGNINVTADWSLNGGSTLTLVAYFGLPAEALKSGTNLIPSSMVEGSANGTAYSPFTANAVTAGGVPAGVDGGTYVVSNTPITTTGGATGTVTSPLFVRLNTTGQKIAAGTYTGVLNLRAIVQ